MEIETTPKGALYYADCKKCGATLYSHEYAHWDHCERRDAMEKGTLRCDHCGIGRADPNTFTQAQRRQYAGRYSASGYLDCTDWEFHSNYRELIRTLRDLYEY